MLLRERKRAALGYEADMSALMDSARAKRAQAVLELEQARGNSDSSISPSWRLPSRRRKRSSEKYRIRVRMKMTAKKDHPGTSIPRSADITRKETDAI